jgi:hypothetical protein
MGVGGCVPVPAVVAVVGRRPVVFIVSVVGPSLLLVLPLLPLELLSLPFL